MACINPNSPEFKAALERTGGNPLLAEIEVNALEKASTSEKVSSEMKNLQSTIDYKLLNEGDESLERKTGKPYIFLSEKDAERFNHLVEKNKGFPSEFMITSAVTRYEKDENNPLKFNSYNEYSDFIYKKSNKNKRSNLYDVIDKKTGEVIMQKARVLSVSKDAKAEISSKYGEVRNPTKIYNANRSVAFALYRQKPSKAKYIAQAKRYIYDAIKFLNPEQSNLKINLDKIEDFLSSFPEEMWDYINTTYSPENSTDVNASISLQNKIKFGLPKLGLLTEIEKITGKKLQGASFKNYDRSGGVKKVLKVEWGEPVIIDYETMSTRQLKKAVSYYLKSTGYFKPSSEEENVRKYAEHNRIDYDKLRNLVFGDFDEALKDIAYNRTGNSDDIELSKWRESVRNYEWQAIELFEIPYTNFKKLAKNRVSEKFKDKNLSNGISHLDYFFSGGFNWLNINFNNVSGEYYESDMETLSDTGWESKVLGILNPFIKKEYRQPIPGKNFLEEKEVFNRLAAILHEPFHALHALSYGTAEEKQLRKSFDNLYKTEFGKKMMEEVFGSGYNQNQQVSYDTLYKEFTAFATQLMLYPKNWINKTDLRSNDIYEFIQKVQSLQDKTYEEIVKTKQKVGTIEKTITEEEQIKLSFLEKLYNYIVKALNNIIPLSKRFINILPETNLVSKKVIEDVFGEEEETITKTAKLPENVKVAKEQFLEAMEELKSSISTLMSIDASSFSSSNASNFFTSDKYNQESDKVQPDEQEAVKPGLSIQEQKDRLINKFNLRQIKRYVGGIGAVGYTTKSDKITPGFFKNIAEWVRDNPLYQGIDIVWDKGNNLLLFREKTSRQFFQTEEMPSSEASPKVISLVKDLLNRMGVTYKGGVDSVRVDGVKLSAPAVAEITRGVIQVIEGKEETSLPEETMHFFVEIIKQTNPALYKKLMSEINDYRMKSRVFDEYGNDPDYQINGKPDVVKLKEEAIAKVLVEKIINRVDGTNEKPELDVKTENWWRTILNWFKQLLFKSGFDQASLDIISGKAVGTVNDIRAEKGKFFKQQSIQDVLYENLINTKNIITKLGDDEGYVDKEGNPIRRVTDTVKDFADRLFADKALTDSEYDKTVYNLKKMKGTDGHKDLEQIFKTFVDENGYLRDVPLDDEGYTSRLNPYDKRMYNILKNNLENRLLRYNNNPSGGKTRFLSEVVIYNSKQKGGLAGTLDFIAIRPDGKVSVLDWKFMGINTDRIEQGDDDIAFYNIRSWNAQMKAYLNILEKAYGVKQNDVEDAYMVPIATEYKGGSVYLKTLPTLSGIEVGDVDILKIDKPYLVPVGLERQSSGDERIDDLLDKLNATYEKISEKQALTTSEKASKSEQLNSLLAAIRQLKMRKNIVPLIEQAAIFNKAVRTLIERYETTYKGNKGLSDEQTSNFWVEIETAKYSLETYTDLDINLDFLFEGRDLTDEEKATKEKLKETVSQARRLLSEVNRMGDKYIDELIARPEGVDNILKPEKVIKGITRWVSTTSTIQLSSVQVLFNKANRALAYAAMDTNSDITKLNDIKRRYLVWAKSKGLSSKNTFDLIKKKDKNELIDQFKGDFYSSLQKAIKERDVEWIKKNIDTVAYGEHLVELKKEEYERIENKPSNILLPDTPENAEENKKISNRIATQKAKADMLYDISTLDSKGWLLYKDIKKFPNKSWESEQWKELNKPENSPALEFYNYIKDKNEEYSNIGYVNKKVARTFLPFVRKGTMEKLVMGGKFSLGEQFLRSITIDEGDVGYGQIDPLTGRPVNKVPRYFTSEIGGELSEDLFRTMALYAEMANKYKYLTQIEPQIRALVQLERNKKAIATSWWGKTRYKGDDELEYTRDNSENTEILDDMTKAIIYGQKYVDSQAFDQLLFKVGSWGESINKKLGFKLFPEDIKERQVSLNKMIDNLNNNFQMVTLGLNPLSSISNLFGGTAQSIINSGKWFTKTDFISAEMLVFTHKLRGEDGKKLIGALNYFLPLTDNYNKEIAKSLSLNTLSSENIQEGLMILMRKADFVVQTSNFYAFLKNTIVENGEVKNAREVVRKMSKYADIYNVDEETRAQLESSFEEDVKKLIEEKGVLKLAKIENGEFVIPGVERKSESVVKLRKNVQALTKDVLGNLSEDDLRRINMNVYGKSFMVFKNWIPRPADVRFGGLKYNSASDAYEWGRMRTVFRYLSTDTLKALGGLKSAILGKDKEMIENIKTLFEKKREEYKKDTGKELKMTEAEFIDLVRRNMKAQMIDTIFLLTLAALFYGLKVAEPDEDEDPIVRNQYKFLLKATDKLRDELLYFYNPTSIIGLISTGFFPSMRMIDTYTDLVKNFSQEMFGMAIGDETMQEEAYPLKYLMKSFPILNVGTSYMPMYSPELAKELDIKMQSRSGIR